MQTFEVRLRPKGFLQSFSSMPSYPSSNTIFGAICWGIRAVWGKQALKQLLDDFTSHPSFFFLSSSFPLLEADGFTVRFFPKQKGRGLHLEQTRQIARQVARRAGKPEPSPFEAANEYKKYRKFSCVSEELFYDILSGKREADLFRGWLENEIIGIGNLLLKKEEYDRLVPQKELLLARTFPQARNAIDRLGGSTSGGGEFFYDFRISCPSKSLLFFLLKAKDIDFLKPVFKYLEDTGIGGERTIGLNHFSIQPDEAKPGFPHEEGGSKKLVTLSRWQANPDELDVNKQEEFYYELLPLRQKLETGYDFKGQGIIWKGKTLYFLEGSVLFVTEKRDYYGQLWQSLKVGTKTVVDYGIAFPAFFKEKT